MLYSAGQQLSTHLVEVDGGDKTVVRQKKPSSAQDQRQVDESTVIERRKYLAAGMVASSAGARRRRDYLYTSRRWCVRRMQLTVATS